MCINKEKIKIAKEKAVQVIKLFTPTEKHLDLMRQMEEEKQYYLANCCDKAHLTASIIIAYFWAAKLLVDQEAPQNHVGFAVSDKEAFLWVERYGSIIKEF